jgi:hypothetical protein
MAPEGSTFESQHKVEVKRERTPDLKKSRESNLTSLERRAKFNQERLVKVKEGVRKWREARSRKREEFSAEQDLKRGLIASNLDERAVKMHKILHPASTNEKDNDSSEDPNQTLYQEIYKSASSHKVFTEKFNGTPEQEGWISKYQKAKQNGEIAGDSSLEQYVYSQMEADLEVNRRAVVEARSVDLSLVLYSAETDESKINLKRQEIVDKTNLYFDENKAEIDSFLEPESKVTRDSLYVKYVRAVFGPEYLKFNQIKKAEVRRFFDAIFDDYFEKILELEAISRRLPKMIDWSIAGISEEEWNKRLEEFEKSLNEKEEQQKQQEAQMQTAITFNTAASSDALDFTPEKIDSANPVTVIPLGNGEYQIAYKGNNYQSKFKIVYLEGKNGKKAKKYVFIDQNQDSEQVIIDPTDYSRKINAVYLDSIANVTIRKGRDYVGPDLNEFLPDEQMNKIADLLFYPKKLDSVQLNETEYIDSFRRLMIVITNNSNLEQGSGIYGNLRAMQNRISLVFNILMIKENALKVRVGLQKLSEKNLKSISLEAFAQSIGIVPNQGNFEKK